MIRIGRALYAGIAATAMVGIVVAATVGVEMGRNVESESGVIHVASLGVPLTHLCCFAALLCGNRFQADRHGQIAVVGHPTVCAGAQYWGFDLGCPSVSGGRALMPPGANSNGYTPNFGCLGRLRNPSVNRSMSDTSAVESE